MRKDGRQYDKIRPIKITRNYIKHAEGSVLISAGDTRIICSASIEEKAPPHLRNTGTGWVTAEYSMLPRATNRRNVRDRISTSGRIYEIQRLIGRSLRSVIDLDLIGERTIIVDCDVIQADGGTRTLSITGGFIALVEALHKLKRSKVIQRYNIQDYLAASSVGIVDGKPMLDLAYEEDFRASFDMNVAMTGKGKIVEVQGTAEGEPLTGKELNNLIALAKKGIDDIINIQKEIIKEL